jgi:hypothetical protein
MRNYLNHNELCQMKQLVKVASPRDFLKESVDYLQTVDLFHAQAYWSSSSIFFNLL